jgi:mannose-1-phosphate guanylyltransferase
VPVWSDMETMYAVILAGGKGTRFWPFSRAERPKQFLDVTGEGSMLGLTFRRLSRIVPPEQMYVFTVSGMESAIRQELPTIPAHNVLSEPVGRNTAPSLAVAAALVQRNRGDVPMLCCPADHLIGMEEEFYRLVEAAADVAIRRDVLITFGIKPEYPSTGYGYIEAGKEAAESGGRTFFHVDRFHEKPDIGRARDYMESNSFFWNSGIFVWRPSVFLTAWREFVPEGIGPFDEIVQSLGTERMKATIASVYHRLPCTSVDYAVLEKAGNVLVAPAVLEWSDVGSWDALFDVLPANASGNRVVGYTKTIDSRGNLFFNPHGATVAIGIEDAVVVVNGSSVLVCKRGQSQKVREILEEIEKDGKTDLL